MPGTVWLTPHTLADTLRDLVLSLYEHGIGRIAVVNGHGGNFVLDSEIRELNRLHEDLIILNLSAWPHPEGTGQTGRVTGGDIHAGAGETATQLFLNPDDVRTEHIDHIPDVGREFLDYAYMMHISPMGVWGEPSQGTAEMGEQGIQRIAEHMACSAIGAFEQIAAVRRQRTNDRGVMSS
jgi:creatinine amidohydrolase